MVNGTHCSRSIAAAVEGGVSVNPTAESGRDECEKKEKEESHGIGIGIGMMMVRLKGMEWKWGI